MLYDVIYFGVRPFFLALPVKQLGFNIARERAFKSTKEGVLLLICSKKEGVLFTFYPQRDYGASHHKK